MDLGLGSYAFRWALGHAAFRPSEPWTLRRLVEESAAHGVTLLQIADRPELDEASPRERRELRAYAQTFGIRLQNGTSGLTEARLRAQLEAATDLGSDVVRLVLDADGVHPTVEESVTILRRVAPDFEECGVLIAIENHFMTPSTDLVSIVERTDSVAVGVCLDTANSVMVGEWPERTIELLAPHCVNVHLKDYAVFPDEHGVGGHVVGRPIGDGWLDLGSLLATVDAADERLDGRLGVVLEQWQPLGGTESEALGAERMAREKNLMAARHLLADRLASGKGADHDR